MIEEDHRQFQYFIPPLHQPSSSLSSPIFFSFPKAQDERESDHHPGSRELQKNQHQAIKSVFNGGSSDHQSISSSCSNHGIAGETKDAAEDHTISHDFSSYPSEMMSAQRSMSPICARNDKQERIMQNFLEQEREKGGNGIVRTCSNCNTTKTPLWRSGPQGPRSLCNACGIRQRKARRAMAAAAEAASDSPAPRIKVQKNENKMGSSFKKALKLHDRPRHKLSFEEFALGLIRKNSTTTLPRSFPKDEEEAAILLMALSCGLLHS